MRLGLLASDDLSKANGAKVPLELVIEPNLKWALLRLSPTCKWPCRTL